jgi:hypothetical protein
MNTEKCGESLVWSLVIPSTSIVTHLQTKLPAKENCL